MIFGNKTSKDAQNYSLSDGTNTPRQLTDLQGEITLSARYTPWGDSLELHGTGDFSFGYFGGVLDATTGLLYVGNGQYYDPATGRFLTRNVNPNSTNPYVPWNPIGAIIGPLGLIALVFGRKKKGSKAGMFLVLVLVVGSVGMTLAGCGPAPVPTEEPTIPPNGTPMPGPENGGNGTPVGAPSPLPTLEVPCSTTNWTNIDWSDYQQAQANGLDSWRRKGVTFSGEWTGNGFLAVTQALNMIEVLLLGKTNSGVGLVPELNFQGVIGTGEGAQASPWESPKRVQMYMVVGGQTDSLRTVVIHELGHNVDWHAGAFFSEVLGNPPSESINWVGEWKYEKESLWTFTGQDSNDTPSDYILLPNSTSCDKPHCPAEDYAETFTWLVYNASSQSLDSLDYRTNYRIPSTKRLEAVRRSITLLP